MRRVNRRVRRGSALFLGAMPITLPILLCLGIAAEHHAANPGDKPMAGAMAGLLFRPDPLSGQLLFRADSIASLERLGVGLGASTLPALLAGRVPGILPPVRAACGAC